LLRRLGKPSSLIVAPLLGLWRVQADRGCRAVATGHHRAGLRPLCPLRLRTCGHRNIDRLAVIHKRTALPQTEGLFIGAFERLHPEYRNIQLELVRIDTFSSSVPRDPHRYRLVATTNLFGDILSDQTSGLAGGVAVAPSLIAGSEHAMAQGVHGTAPDIARRGIANSSALILSTSLLLNWFYQRTRIEACRETARLLDRSEMRSPAASQPRISVAMLRPTHLRPRYRSPRRGIKALGGTRVLSAAACIGRTDPGSCCGRAQPLHPVSRQCGRPRRLSAGSGVDVAPGRGRPYVGMTRRVTT
jgi:hypothetical protein